MRSKQFIAASLGVAFAILACSPSTPRPAPAPVAEHSPNAKAPSRPNDASAGEAGIVTAGDASEPSPAPRNDGTFYAARVTELTVSGDAGANDIKLVERSLDRRAHALERCFAAVAKKSDGRMRVELSLGNKIPERDVRIVESSFADAQPAFAKCVTKAIDEMAFDEYLPAPIRVRATIAFGAAPDPAIALGVRVTSKIQNAWAGSGSYGQSYSELDDALAAAAPRFAKCYATHGNGTSRSVSFFATLDWGPGTGGWSTVEVEPMRPGDAGTSADFELAFCVAEAFRRPRFGHHISSHVTIGVSFEPVPKR